jgi:hypothetical protein
MYPTTSDSAEYFYRGRHNAVAAVVRDMVRRTTD